MGSPHFTGKTMTETWQQLKNKIIFTQPLDPQSWMDSWLAEHPLSDWAAGPVATKAEIKERQKYINRCKPGDKLIFSHQSSPLEYHTPAFYCGPNDHDDEERISDGAGIYEELEELFNDVNGGKKDKAYIHLGGAIEIGSSENYHEYDIEVFKQIPGFPSNLSVEDTIKEIKEFINNRLFQLGAIDGGDFDG